MTEPANLFMHYSRLLHLIHSVINVPLRIERIRSDRIGSDRTRVESECSCLWMRAAAGRSTASHRQRALLAAQTPDRLDQSDFTWIPPPGYQLPPLPTHQPAAAARPREARLCPVSPTAQPKRSTQQHACTWSGPTSEYQSSNRRACVRQLLPALRPRDGGGAHRGNRKQMHSAAEAARRQRLRQAPGGHLAAGAAACGCGHGGRGCRRQHEHRLRPARKRREESDVRAQKVVGDGLPERCAAVLLLRALLRGPARRRLGEGKRRLQRCAPYHLRAAAALHRSVAHSEQAPSHRTPNHRGAPRVPNPLAGERC